MGKLSSAAEALDPAKLFIQRFRNPLRLLLSPRHARHQGTVNAEVSGHAGVDPAVKIGPASVRVMFGVNSGDLHNPRYTTRVIGTVKTKVDAGTKLSKPEWAARISGMRKRRGLSQAALANLLGLSQVAVSKWETGRDTPTAQNYLKLGHISGDPDCWYFWERAGLSPDAVTAALPRLTETLYKGPQTAVTVQPALGSMKENGTRLKKTPDAVAVPLLRDPAAAGSPRMIQEAQVEDVVVIPRKMCPHPEATVCIRVKGDSMSPILEDNDVVAIDTSYTERAKLYGKMVAARDPEGGVTIKWLRRSGKDELLVPQHTSMRHQPIVITNENDWKVVGKVIWRLGIFN